MPSKIFGPACAERPMIISAHESCEICAMARANGFGVVVPAGDVKALIDAIYRLKNDKTLATTVGKSGHNFMLQNRDMNNILGDFEQKIIMRYAQA